MSEIILSKDNFENEVIKSDIPVLIDFWAVWCGPCKMIAPIIEEISEEYDGKIKVCKLNVDDEPELASSFNIMSIPTVALVKEGKLSGVSVGYLPKEQLLKELGL